MNNNDELDKDPWYKQWMVWMIIVPPATAVVAGIVTINLAIQSDDGLVVDDYYKQGLAINKIMMKDDLALKMGVLAGVKIQDNKLIVSLNKAVAEEVLSFKFVHPTQSMRDKSYTLTQTSGREYGASLGAVPSGHWNLLLQPKSQAWRIVGRINMDMQIESKLGPNE